MLSLETHLLAISTAHPLLFPRRCPLGARDAGERFPTEVLLRASCRAYKYPAIFFLCVSGGPGPGLAAPIMAAIFLLLALCAVMALASFLAGVLPLSMTLSQSQLRLVSSIGVGVLVGTSLIVIIPEGIEAAATQAPSHAHGARSLAPRAPWRLAVGERAVIKPAPAAYVVLRRDGVHDGDADSIPSGIVVPSTHARSPRKRKDEPPADTPADTPAPGRPAEDKDKNEHEEGGHAEIPAFEVGFSMVAGFVLMFLIDRLPRHATDTFQSTPETTHFSFDNLGGDGASVGDEADGFLGSLAPTPRRARCLATTMGLVIHSAADGIAMGASSTTSNMKMGLLIFIAIMIHKAPAAFGLTSVLLRQGLSKRAARGHLIVFSLAAPVGALSTWLLITLLGGHHMEGGTGQWWTGMLLLFAGGTFLYVAMHAMQEDGGSQSHDHGSASNGYAEGGSANQRKPRGPRMCDTLATVAGMFLPLLTQFGHHH
ncbi:Zinc transporter ZIP9 [Tolypocladium capitatum]|uniref:Zinc transporter ZIP9 n=1 Tax=Tolypocladium capitatum TaxID=45235 RepID=A0A2K3QAX1_9HYPO|nr:Zinc transporter ZIP9 [Tolypocladium capitatum]